MSIIERIEQRLKATGLSARAASLKAGLSADYIRDLQRGRVDSPTAGKLDAE